ncbi:rod shape-determining protein MreC [bacterium]|nr:MAG: rod shape-determining protein MreC [bacterium]
MHGGTRSRSTGLFLTLGAAMLLLAMLSQQSWATGARGEAKSLLAPLESGMTVAAGQVDRVVSGFGDVLALRAENRRLQSENEVLRREVAELSAAGRDNAALRKALDFERSYGRHLVAAQVVGRGPDGFSRTLEIDRGTADGVQPGMIVASGAGLVGRVREAGPHAAIVQTLADPQSRVNVFLSRSELEGTVTGGPAALQLQIEHRLGVIPASGEWAITSGVGGGYPRGLVVGEVAGVDHRDSATADQASVAWVNDPASLSLVLVVTDFIPA